MQSQVLVNLSTALVNNSESLTQKETRPKTLTSHTGDLVRA